MDKSLNKALFVLQEFAFEKSLEIQDKKFEDNWFKKLHRTTKEISAQDMDKITHGNLDFTSIATVISLLYFMPRENPSKTHLVKALDQASIEILNSNLDKVQALSLCYSWLDAGVFNWSKQSTITYPKICSERFLTNAEILDNLSPKEFLMAFFMTSLYRMIPGAKKLQYSDGFWLPKSLEAKCLEIMPSLDHVEIGVLANSLQLGNIHIDGNYNKLDDMFFEALISLPVDLLKTPYSPLNELLKITSKELMTVKKGSGILLVLDKLKGHWGQVGYPDQIRFLNFLRVNPPKQKVLKVHLKEHCERLQDQVPIIKRIKDLNMIASGLFSLNYHVIIGRDIFVKLLDQLSNRWYLDNDPRSGKNILQILNFCAKAGVLEEEKISYVLDKANNYEPFSRDKLPTLEECIQFSFSLSGCKSKKILDRQMQTELRNSEGFNRNSIFSIAELDYEIELNHPMYQGTRLAKNVRKTLLNMLHYDDQLEDAKFDKPRFYVYQELCHLMGMDNLYFGKVIPTSWAMKDIVLCANGSGESLELPNDFLNSLLDGTEFVRPPLENGNCY